MCSAGGLGAAQVLDMQADQAGTLIAAALSVGSAAVVAIADRQLRLQTTLRGGTGPIGSVLLNQESGVWLSAQIPRI